MTENSEFISIRVSHVSRLFRDISLRTPRLWTRHSTDHGLDQIHAFLSRSGHCNIQVEITSFPKADMGSFLQLLAPHSNRWSRLTLDDCELDPIFQELGLFNLPRLRFLCHRSPTDLCAFNLPMLSHIMVEKDFWYQNLPFQSQLTWVELFLHQFTSNETAELALALYQMRGLRDLSLEFVDCNPFHPAYHHDGAGIHEPHTFPIESLSITISGSPKRGFVTGLYDALSYFVATTVDISLQFDPPVRNAHTFIFGSTLGWFPYASMISIHTPLSCDVLYILENIARHCAIAQSVRFEVSTITDFEHTFDFQNLGSIQHLHIRNCDTLSEKVVEKLAKNLSLLTLEITTCKMISEEFLLNVSDEVGEKIKWAI
ncbi:hypothetical protein BD410DRAFT_792299 [Rickenella mellea]|uniref:F-box domain-containing protein n=1 Tax=Rickenella mellea TaxID=50990 RepID=A0A4Y7PW47_9AGAM|nr:hypothetical protein BD410DRAFT_792299 [Rickenella mellea]